MAFTPATNRQVPDHAILDNFYKQTYLGNAYIVSVPAIDLSTTSETGLILIQNPVITTSAFPANNVGVFVNLRRFSSDSEQVVIKTYVNPIVSSVSTKTTPVNLRPASANTSIAKVYGSGEFSLSSNGTLISAIGCAADDYVVMDNLLLVILDPGQMLLITGTALTEDTNVNADISWFEL